MIKQEIKIWDKDTSGISLDGWLALILKDGWLIHQVIQTTTEKWHNGRCNFVARAVVIIYKIVDKESPDLTFLSPGVPNWGMPNNVHT